MRPRPSGLRSVTCGSTRCARCCVLGDDASSSPHGEIEVLAYLLDMPAESSPRPSLLEAVWGHGFDGDPNIVEVYVCHLRRKLDEPFGRTSIETVRGAGYRLRVEEPA